MGWILKRREKLLRNINPFLFLRWIVCSTWERLLFHNCRRKIVWRQNSLITKRFYPKRWIEAFITLRFNRSLLFHCRYVRHRNLARNQFPCICRRLVFEGWNIFFFWQQQSHPPKPAPVIRAPKTPLWAWAASTKVSSSIPVTTVMAKWIVRGIQQFSKGFKLPFLILPLLLKFVDFRSQHGVRDESRCRRQSNQHVCFKSGFI